MHLKDSKIIIMKEFNPFNPKYSFDYFCGREKEINRLEANINNGYNTLIHSERRIGKTVMIKYLLNKLEKEGSYETIYIDLFSTSSMSDFIKQLTERILEKYHKNNLLSGIKKLLFGINASFSLDANGIPKVSLSLKNDEIDSTLGQLFGFLNNRKKRIVIAFDEFQEIVFYPEKAEAIIRTYAQYSENISFIYAGSTNHMLRAMFYSASKPFYQSSDIIVLPKIPYETYWAYLESLFMEFKRKIDKNALDFILDFTDRHTYYTQFFCNYVFYKSGKNISLKEVMTHSIELLENRRDDYMGLYRLLSANQRKIAIAIAKEEVVLKPLANNFLHQYKLPTPSSVSLAVKTLIEKEVLYSDDNGVKIYDVFFRRFLNKYF